MFKVSKSASIEIKRSLQEHEFDDMPIRIAAQRNADGSIDYQMGFDEPGPGDTMIASSGVDVVIARDHLVLLNGGELDFVTLDEGGKHFIFLNPNDPNFVPPAENDANNAAPADPESQATRAMVDRDSSSEEYLTRRGELSAYGRAANSARTLQQLVVLLTLLVIAIAVSSLVFLDTGTRTLVPALLLLAICAVAGISWIWFYASKNFIEPDLAFRKWLQQVCDGDLEAQIDLDESHTHYKELNFHTRNLASSLNRLSTDMETLVDNQTRRLEYQNRSLDLLYKLTADVSREADREAMLRTVCQYLHDWFSARVVSGMLVDSDPDQSLLVQYPDNGNIASGEKMPALVQEIDYSPVRGSNEYHLIRVPVQHGGVVAGVLEIETEQFDPPEQEKVDRVLNTIAEQLSLCLSKQSAAEQSRTAQMVRDRNALAADIHDSLAQTLAALRYQVTLLQEGLDTKSVPDLNTDVKRIQGTVSEANQEVRGLIQEFRHPLSHQRSADEIRATVENFRESSGMQVFFQTDDPQLSFTPREESQLQRIIGEALNNAEKYSQASMVRVYLRCDDSGVRRILIEDDGIGFRHGDLPSAAAISTDNGGNHIGLTIMQERASSVGGTLSIESEPGEGTRISIDLPPHAKFAGE